MQETYLTGDNLADCKTQCDCAQQPNVSVIAQTVLSSEPPLRNEAP